MREWQLKAGDPLALTLACDTRLTPSDYCNDQIWELNLGGGDPPALSVQTTYGLRARLMRIFPRFQMGETVLSDPAEFAQPPLIRQVYPNFIELHCAPFPGIDVCIEYWVPQSHAIAGRVQVTNNGATDARLVMEWAAQLSLVEGQRMAPVELQASTVLSGQTEGLAPLVFLTGGPRPGSGAYPALALRMDLPNGAGRTITWVHAALETQDSSFNLARSTAAINWEAERARLELMNGRQVEIFTGDADWDAALMLAQKHALGLFVGPTGKLEHPSLVLVRQPDQGFSRRGDGADYNHLWNGQPPLESYFLASQVLPAAPELARGLALNFIQAQAEDGAVDWKPGLAGQRSKILATPLLASLCWRIYESTEDRDFLGQVFDPLLRFLQRWFDPAHDRDGDGVPEWDHPMQAGDEDHPVYSHWHAWSQGVEISTAENAALLAFLYRECQSLARMARVLERQAELPGLETAAERLKAGLEAAYDEAAASYFDRDRDTHASTHGEALLEAHGSGLTLLQRAFDRPVRLLINIRTDETIRRRPVIFIHGRSAGGRPRIERITDEQFRWTPGHGRLTGKYVYSWLERVEVHGLEPEDSLSLHSVGYDFQDHSLLLPLWAGTPRPARARQLVEETLTNPERYWRLYGIPACMAIPLDADPQICGSVSMIWNTLIGEGLLRYNFKEQAAELLTRLMNAAVQSLKRERAFRRFYSAETGQGSGERHALSGLAPLSLFLDVLGVRLISASRVEVRGFNPFPRPVTVKYRGLTVLCHKEKTIVIFPDGQTVTVDDPQPRVISLQ
ncbi:MAG: MGH1-like glycoside hydrolase domain-containing protein [Chloroflexota bacterium]